MKKLFISALCGLSSLCAFAAGPSFSASAELYSSYIWRGMECSSDAALAPSVNMEWGNFNVNLWGIENVSDDYNEIDLSVSYTFGDITLCLNDMYYPYAGVSYFNWRKGESSHQLDLMLSYEPENLPVRAMWSTYVLGDDYKADGKRAYSSYAEVEWSHEFGDICSVSAIAGANFLEGMYSDKSFSFVNLGASCGRTFNIGPVGIPVSLSYTFNPVIEKSYFSVGASIEF